MSDQNRIVEGNILPPQSGKLGSIEAYDALNTIVSAVQQSFQTHQVESTKREKLKTYRETEVQRIKASEAVLRDYFDRVFAERSDIHQKLFDSLDAAMVKGDAQAIQTIVGGIVEVAKTSPLANLGDLGELRRAMDDPNTIFEF